MEQLGGMSFTVQEAHAAFSLLKFLGYPASRWRLQQITNKGACFK
jgi:hypothetical protein